MSIGSQTVGLASILKEGLKTYKGIDGATLQNIAAVLELGDLTRTSVGPCGAKKLVPSAAAHRTVVTGDCRTVLAEANVFHPAAKLLADAAQQHGLEHGDGSGILVVVCCALLARAGELVRQGVRPGLIARGFELALAQALQLLDGLVIERAFIDWRDASADQLSCQLAPIMRTAVCSKHGDAEGTQLVGLAARAMAIAVPHDRPARFDLDNVRVVKVLGGSLGDSRVLRGLVLNRLPETRLKTLGTAGDGECTENASSARALDSECRYWKVAVFSCELDLPKTESKGTVLITKAEQMQRLTADEEDELARVFGAIKAAGVRLLVTSERVGELALHVLDRLDLVALKLPSKFDVRRVCRATGAQCLTSLSHPQLPEALGRLSFLAVQQIGADWVCVLDGPGAVSSVLLRGSVPCVLDEHERAIVSAVAAARSLLISERAAEVEAESSKSEQGDSETRRGSGEGATAECAGQSKDNGSNSEGSAATADDTGAARECDVSECSARECDVSECSARECSAREFERKAAGAEGTRKRLVAMVAGAGAFEAELCKRLKEWASEMSSSIPTLHMMGVRTFAEALLAVPEALADNAGLSALDAVGALEAAHLQGDLCAGILAGDQSVPCAPNAAAVPAGNATRDLLGPKREALKMATKIACMLLSIEQILVSKPVTGAPTAQRPASTMHDD